MAAGAALAILGALLPWIRTGGRSRNSFDLFRIVRDLGFAPDGGRRRGHPGLADRSRCSPSSASSPRGGGGLAPAA